MRLPILMLVVALAPGAAGLVRAQPSPSVSILAGDQGTHLHPLARLAEGRWTPLPAGVLAHPPQDWIRRYALGRATPVRVGPATGTGACTTPGLLPVTGQPAQPADRTSGYVGLAVAGPAQLDAVTRVAHGSREWTSALAALGPVFERRAGTHGVQAAALAGVPMTIDVLYSTARSGRTVYYFEASKRIPDAGDTPDEDPRGIVRVAVSGWLRDDGTRIEAAGTRSELHWDPEDAPPAVRPPALTPLGVVRHGDETIWVMREQRGLRDTLSLYELGPSTVHRLFTVDAAVC